jgi:hypothetical protein
MARLILGGGLRGQPRPAWAYEAIAGIGGAYESYNAIGSSRSGLTPAFEVKLRGEYMVLPQKLAIRGRLDTLFLRVTGGTSGDRNSELDAFLRIFGDVEALRLYGFVPSAHVGLNFAHVFADLPSASAIAPVFRVGVRRAGF